VLNALPLSDLFVWGIRGSSEDAILPKSPRLRKLAELDVHFASFAAISWPYPVPIRAAIHNCTG
jgi:hypothetical protein